MRLKTKRLWISTFSFEGRCSIQLSYGPAQQFIMSLQ
jgi:hypothetical protein